MQIFDIHFMQSFYLYLLFLLPVFLYLYIRKEKTHSVKMHLEQDEKKSLVSSLFFLKLFLISLIFIIFLFIASDPHSLNTKEKNTKNWIDIVLILDISKSMDATDLSPTRIEKSKQVLQKFISAQNTNRVWLIVFSWAPFIWIPLTFDYEILTESIKGLNTDSLNWNTRLFNWTAIWDALLLSKSLFETIDDKSKTREKTVILLTDWDANKGVDPSLVADLLKKENIKIYSIWIWSEKWSFVEINNWFFSQKVPIPPLKSEWLKEMSKKTWWYFFNWKDDDTMEKIFKKLEELEKNDIEVEVDKIFKELYSPFVYLALALIWILLFLEIRRVKV